MRVKVFESINSMDYGTSCYPSKPNRQWGWRAFWKEKLKFEF